MSGITYVRTTGECIYSKGCISKRLRYIQKHILYPTAIIGMYVLALLNAVIMFPVASPSRTNSGICTPTHFLYRRLWRERGTVSLMHFVR